jgi:RND superfamily putative drug exporter
MGMDCRLLDGGTTMNKWISGIFKLRYAVLSAWLIMASLSLFLLPDLPSIVRSTEQKFLPAHAQSVQATALLQQINPSSRSLSQAVLVLSRKDGLTKEDQNWLRQLLAQIEADQAELGITSLLSSQSQPALAERLQSKDGTTQLAIINLPEADFEDRTKLTLNRLQQLLEAAPEGASAALTGSASLSQDYQQASQSGLRRTELLTIGLVLFILLLVFRSPVTPLIPLLTIGVSLLISRGLIAVAASYGMPVSHFTESFLIAVLFGAGTDYCILLIQRYREELVLDRGNNGITAMSRTLASVGKTIIYSASTVFTAFFLIGFAEFGLYRSAVGVAIGVLVTVAASLTLAPAMLLLFGKAILWPLNNLSSHNRKPSKLWGVLAPMLAKRSGVVLIITIIILTPLTLLFNGQRSFDDISEISSSSESIVAFHQVERAFGSGELFPVTMAVTSTQSMRTPSGLAALEQAGSELTRMEGVDEVRSAMRPLGRLPEKLTVPGRIQGPNADSIINVIINQQQALTESIQTLALSANSLSKGLIGIWPAMRQLEKGLSQLIASQLEAFQLSPGADEGSVQSQDKEPPLDEASKQAIDYYISPDGLTTRFEILLHVNPYSADAMDMIEPLTEQLRESLDATAIADPVVFTTGVSAKYKELRTISYSDFLNTGLLVLAGIALVLALMLRSLVAPIYVLLSLGFNYLITMGITEFLFVKVLGYAGLSWTVSFFIFLIIVALGVDYSIFLMARFKEEYHPGGTAPAMVKAMRTTGGVIVAAAVIMAGTFGALSFSGVGTLIQIGVGTLIGLIVYATVFMGLIVPAFTFLLGEANWWPFRGKQKMDKSSSD